MTPLHQWCEPESCGANPRREVRRRAPASGIRHPASGIRHPA
ncbi:hypothetical protein [Ornithinibacter aureus]|nr:hypothetical protein [Ornithinibacter aureus]